MTGTLYAALAGAHTTSDLYTVDPSTAVMTSVGPIGFAVSGLAVDPTDGTLYGSTSRNSGSHPKALITIDTSTGAGTLVGDYGLGTFENAHDITFDATGQLWGWDTGSPHGLWMIDKTTGTVTSNTAFTTESAGGALDFDSGGTLWQVANWDSKILTIDTATAVQTVITTTDDPGNWAHSGKFDSTDLFWASYPGGTGSASPNLVTIDVNTGTVTVIAAFSTPGVGGLAWAGAAPPPAPFSLAASPSSFTRTAGGVYTLHSTITSTLLSGAPEDITLSITSTQPSGVGASLSPTTISDDGGTSTLTLTLDGTQPIEMFTVTVHGDDGSGGTANVGVSVDLIAEPPGFHIAS